MFRHWAWQEAQPESQLLRIQRGSVQRQEEPAATGQGTGVLGGRRLAS